jgi:hypothetical protein
MGSEGRIVTENTVHDIAQWCGGRVVIQHDALDHEKTVPAVNVPVKNEVHRASIGDVVIQNHDGSFQIHKTEW